MLAVDGGLKSSNLRRIYENRRYHRAWSCEPSRLCGYHQERVARLHLQARAAGQCDSHCRVIDSHDLHHTDGTNHAGC